MKLHWMLAFVFYSSVFMAVDRLVAAENESTGAGRAAPTARPEPQILSLSPLGAARGARLQVEVRGRSLEEAYAILVDCSSITAEVKTIEPIGDEDIKPARRSEAVNAGTVSRAVVELAVAADARIGSHSLRVVSPGGVSNTSSFVVHEEPLTFEKDLPEDAALAARRLPAGPVAVSGKIGKPGEVDTYFFEAQQGQELFFEILNVSGFDPQLSLWEPSGTWFSSLDLRRLAFNDEPNRASKKLNPSLTYRFERKGRFLIQVGAFLGQGSADCSYQLRVVPATQRNFSLAAATLAHPVEGPWEERDFARELGLDRLKALRARTVVVPLEKPSERREAQGVASTGEGPTTTSNGPGKGKGLAAESTAEMVLVSHDEVGEAKQVPKIAVPALIEGTIEQPGDVDKLRFQVKNGTRLAFEIQTPQRPGPFFTPRVGVFDESDQEVFNNVYVYAYGSGEYKANVIRSKVIFNFEHGGEYRLEVEDVTSRNGGPDFRYRISVRPQIPHVGRIDVASSFARTFDGSITDGPEVQHLNLVAGGVKKIVVLTEQEEGFNGEIALNFEGLPPGVAVFPATGIQPERPAILDEGKKELYRPAQQEVTVLFVAAPDAPVTRVPHMVRLTAKPVVGGILGAALPVQEFPMMVVKPDEPASHEVKEDRANKPSGDES
ncbi:MAG: hypothetical protein L0387_45050 [Acidobacteria bacterium]|nr:hypothetical protein [Acidobacteriota bacterium]MCI0722065.1 hypothetical protein [Acidobacteriota bacterium]